MSGPRGVQERIDWFLSHKPSGPGMCAQHSWHSLGGDNGSVPAWGCANANEVYDKVIASGRYWTGKPKRGGLVLWKYGNNGHAAIEDDNAGAEIDTTNPDPDDAWGTATGVESIDYPSKWGASSGARIWTDQYNGVRFPVGEEEEDDVKHCYLNLSTSHDFTAGSSITWDSESVDECGFHSAGKAGIVAPWPCVGTFMVETSGGGVVTFRTYNADGEQTGEIGRSVNGDLVVVQNLPKGFTLRAVVVEGTVTSARLKADIRER